MKNATVVWGFVALIVTGCGDPEEPPVSDPTVTEIESPGASEEHGYSQECGDAVAEAAGVGDVQDSVEDLDPAIVACADMDEFTAAVEDHPDALDDADPETFVSNRCQHSEDPEVADSAICADVAGG